MVEDEYNENVEIEEDDYDDIDFEEDQEDAMDSQQDMMEDMAPTPQRRDDLYSLFWKVVRVRESSKVGNLSRDELGMLNISVRDLQRISLLSNMLGHNHFGDFWSRQGEIILATSSSKEGWLPELFVSNKSTRTKSRKYNVQNLNNQSTQKRKGLFKWGK